MTESKAMILGVSGHRLTREEHDFLRGERPWGFIIFARNIREPQQVRDLTAEMRDCVGRPDALVFVDQEGGRVQRFRPPFAPDYPRAASFGRAPAREGRRAAWLLSVLHALDLRRYGVNANCIPVLDVPPEENAGFIGDRAYSHDPDVVTELGRAAVEGLLQGGVLPVMKHIPGHGRAYADSHLELPFVDASADALRGSDFRPFRALAREVPMAMTAHVVYRAFDPVNPATTSPAVIHDIIRGEIGFDGLLMSDDVSMKALSGDFATRTQAILAAGCDVVLHCNGVMDEMRAVASRTDALAGNALRRAEQTMSRLRMPAEVNEAAIRDEFENYRAAMV